MYKYKSTLSVALEPVQTEIAEEAVELVEPVEEVVEEAVPEVEEAVPEVEEVVPEAVQEPKNRGRPEAAPKQKVAKAKAVTKPIAPKKAVKIKPP